jgi:hypothetical protein
MQSLRNVVRSHFYVEIYMQHRFQHFEDFESEEDAVLTGL